MATGSGYLRTEAHGSGKKTSTLAPPPKHMDVPPRQLLLTAVTTTLLVALSNTQRDEAVTLQGSPAILIAQR